MSDWERWLEFCARIDGFPRHLSIHSGGMLVTAAPLIDIAPLERATMKDRVVVQFDKRDVETLKLIKLDLLGLGHARGHRRDAPAHRARLRGLPRPRPDPRGHPGGLRDAPGRRHRRRLPGGEPGPDADAAEVAAGRASTISWWRSRSSGPGPIQGNAVHPYLRRKQGLEPVTYLHPSLEPILAETLGVILYQEQVMKIAIDGRRVHAGRLATASAGRWARGARRARWRSSTGSSWTAAILQPGMTEDDRRGAVPKVAAFASFGFAKSHAAAFARTAYESSFLKLFYPAQFLVGLINAQPMGFYPVEVLVNDAKRHGVAVLPVDINASRYKTTTEWAGRPGWAIAGVAGDPPAPGAPGPHDADEGEPIPDGAGISSRPRPVRSSACFNPMSAARDRWAAADAVGWGVRLGLHLVKGIGEQHEALLDRGAGAGAVHVAGRRRRADRATRGGHRAADPDRRPRFAGPAAARAALATARGRGRVARTS